MEENKSLDNEDSFSEDEFLYESDDFVTSSENDSDDSLVKLDLISFVIYLGSNIIRFFNKILDFILLPTKRISSLIRFTLIYFWNFLKDTNDSFIVEIGSFFNDVKVALLLIKQNNHADKQQKEKIFSLLSKYFKIAITKHHFFIKRSLNYILPVTALIVFIITASVVSDTNFALEVRYNNTHIGYIENENVFRHAKEILEQRLEIGGIEYDEDVISQPEYKIVIVKLSELSDSNDICEQLIAYSDSGLTTACGIYVDNKFIGSVKNESDASSVFKSYISAYCRSNSINQDNPNVMLDLVEKVSYIQGLFPEETLMDSDDLREYIQTNTKSEISKYTTKAKDTPESICFSNSLSIDQFFALNPDLERNEQIKKGTSVNVIKNIPFVNVNVSKTQKSKEEIKFKTIEIQTDSLYKGVKKIISLGENGEKEVVTLISYVNGIEVSRKVISSKTIKNSVDQKVYVGTKPIPNNVTIYGTQNGTFIWPVIGAYTVTSGFGPRNVVGGSSYHKGIDIAGSGANGKPIVASADGTVERVISGNSGYGYNLVIDHGNGIKTRYAHCQAGSISVKVGQKVVQGQVIAKLGNTGNSTGPHLHFEIIYNGYYANPIKYLTR